MRKLVHQVFMQHPQSVEESYGQHFVFAGGFALTLFAAGFAAMVHALVPCLFEKTAGRMVGRLNAKLSNR